jgi:hypothetical protein
VARKLDKLEWEPTEVGELPDVLRLAEAVRESEKPLLLQRSGEAVAVVIPVALAEDFGLRGPITAEDIQAFRAAAGAWKDVDTDKLLEDIYESRGRPARPPVER